MAVELVVDELHPGTNEQIWLRASRLAGLRPLVEGRPRRLVVVTPHPDDEVLGAGGLLQRMQRACVETVVVAVTDGEASHPRARLRGAIWRRRAPMRGGLPSIGWAADPSVCFSLAFPTGLWRERLTV